MSLRKLDELAAIAVLLHGGFILQERSFLLGSCKYYFYCPDQCRDVELGYIPKGSFRKLLDSGFIIVKESFIQDNSAFSIFMMNKSSLNEFFDYLKNQSSGSAPDENIKNNNNLEEIEK